MALPNPPSITVLPSAAYDAGCRASCTISGPKIDGSGNEIYDCSFSATSSTGWRLVDFTWRQSRIVYHKGYGTTTDESFDVSSIENPTNPSTASARIGVTEGRYSRSTYDVLNVVANFEPVAPTTYTITTAVSPSGAGTTTGDGSYNLGSTATITATPNNLFRFLRWELNGATVSTSSTYSFSVTGNATYTAVFEAVPSATIEVQTYSEKAAGYVAPDAIVSINGQSDNDNDFSLVVARGSTVTVGATAYGGLEDPQLWPVPMYFVGWLKYPDYNTILSDSLQYTFTTSQADYSPRYLAKYVTHYTLNTSVRPAASAGTVALSPLSRYGNNLYPEYSNVTLTAAPNPGWKFKHWIKKDRWSEVVVSSATTYSVEITEDLYYDIVYIAVFEWDGTDLLVNSSNLGSPVKLVYDDTSGGTGKLIADY